MRQTSQTFVSGQSGDAVRLGYGDPQVYSYVPSKSERTILVRSDVAQGRILESGIRQPLEYQAEGATPCYLGMLSQSKVLLSRSPYRTAEHLCSASQFVFPVKAHAEIPSGLRNAVVTQMLKRLADVKLSGLTALIESREAVKMIGTAATTLYKALNAASLNNPRARARALARALRTPRVVRDIGTTSASAWKAYHFGWAPVVDDMAKAMAILHGGFLNDRHLLRAAAGTSMETEVKDLGIRRLTVRNLYVVNGLWDYHFPLSQQGSTDFKMSGYWILDNLSVLRDANQIGVLNLPVTVWETTPASFLVDWLIQVKDFLQAFSATVGLTFVAGSESTFSKVELSVGKPEYSTNVSKSRLLEDVHEYFTEKGSSFSFNRKVWKSAPVPYRPTVSDPFSVWRTITALALLEPYGSKGKLNFKH